MLLFLLACDDGGTIRKSTPDDSHGVDTLDDTAGVDSVPGDDTGHPPADADGDGSADAPDCDDGNGAIYPGAVEVCDGVDQDCDGAVDDGVPNDGAGCVDPGWPEFPDTVQIIHLTLRTGSGTYDGTDDGGVTVCLSDDVCLSPYKEEWNDLEAGAIDVAAFEGVGAPRATLSEVTLSTTQGTDLWRPTAMEISFDGERVYCRDLDLDIGDQSDETTSWTDPEGVGVGCDTAFDAPITHGPIVGGIGPDSARLWYRADATRHVELRIATDSASLATSPVVHHGYPAAGDDFTEAVDIAGLTPDTTWWWSLTIDGATYGPWSFTTPPEVGAAGTFRMAFGSCSKLDDQPVFGPITDWDPDLFLLVGDNHYANTAELNGLRQFYRWAHERPLRSDLIASRPMLAIWDDHDYTGNNTDGSASGRDTSLRVFEEYIPNPSYGSADTAGVFTRQAWGDVELFLLDDRYWRGEGDRMLGTGQEAWLRDALASSTATFKIIACGSQFTPYGSDDSWAEFPDAWDDLREALVADGITGVVLLSGDIHRFEARLLDGASGGYDLPEITSSPLAYDPPSSCGSDSTEPDRLFCEGGISGFVGIETDTTLADPTLTATWFDEDGTELHEWEILASELR